MDDATHLRLRQKALALLSSIGDSVYGKTAGGQTYGDASLVTPPPPEPQPRIRRGPRVFWSRMPELQPVLNLPVGSITHVRPPEGVEAKKFQSIVCSIACNRFGKGNYTTVLNGSGVDIVRTA